MSNIRSTYLPKWPGLLVKGEPVTLQEAAEIIVRTDPWDILTNDKDWIRVVERITGVPYTKKYNSESAGGFLRALDDFRASYGVLELEYLHTSRIATCYVGGPHGWVDWAGNVRCSSYNIGKWPTVEACESDWSKIAAAFPYLNLTCQLLDCEAGENDDASAPPPRALVEFRISEGTVETRDPGPLILQPEETGAWTMVERGCTEEQLVTALDITAHNLSKGRQ